METTESCNIKYFNISKNDEAWGLVVTTVGYQLIPSNSSYPRSQHPKSHIFNPKNGRILKEYQLIYISEGEGYFESKSCKRQKIKAGTIILLFPNEWHTYEPDKNTGWFEYWVGFKGIQMDRQVGNGFFTPQNPVYHLGFSPTMIGLYEEIVTYALKEKAGYQQIISSTVLYMLGAVYYKHRNSVFNDSFAINKIDEARSIMKQEIENNVSPEEIADKLAVSYSWFRKMFRQYVDASPAQYQANLKYLRAKELLDTTTMSISDIAYKLSFENVSQFSTFFRKKEGISPLRYRKDGHRIRK